VRHGVPRSLRLERHCQRGEGNDGGKDIGGVDEIVVVNGTHVAGKIAGGYLVRRCSTDEATTKDEV